jgi:hypothetical protein
VVVVRIGVVGVVVVTGGGVVSPVVAVLGRAVVSLVTSVTCSGLGVWTAGVVAVAGAGVGTAVVVLVFVAGAAAMTGVAGVFVAFLAARRRR